jgi:hypothetical protein
MNIVKYAILAAMTFAAPANATTTILDFDGSQACAAACANGVAVRQTYGDTADVDVSYLVRDAFGASTVLSPFQIWWDIGFSDLQGVVTGAEVSEISIQLLTAGKSISLDSFDMGRFTGAARTDLRVYDFGWNLLWSATDQFAPITGERLSYAPGVSSTNGLIIQHGPGSNNRGLDNITYTLSDIVVAPAVPEPASWAMLIAGFGLVGAVMRRQVRRSETASVLSL